MRASATAGWAKITAAWPLWSILAAQLMLTLPWLWRTAPFTDEALYLEAGHREWAHWLHHAVLPDYASWFSGSPVLYPPLAAAADSAGGLAGARALSLIFMLATTALVYLMAERLFGRLAAIFGTLIFALCGLVVHYGAFATFGPLSLLLLVAAAWAGIRIGDGGVGWLPACVLALVAANATKYATLAWDPVVVGIVVLHGWSRGRWEAIAQAASVAATVVVLDLGIFILGGAEFARGVIVTTVFRSIHWGAPSSAGSVLLRALALTGLLVIPAICGAVVSIVRRMPPTATLFLWLLVLASVLAPIEQARIHQLPSLDKNMGYGLPFAALGAGYALSEGRQWFARRWPWGQVAATIAAVALVIAALIAGRLQKVQFRGPGVVVAARVVSAIERYYRPGTYVVSDGAARMEQYYLPRIPSRSWVGTFTPNSALASRIATRICAGQVSIVVLRMSGRSYDHAYDRRLIKLLDASDRFALATVAGQGNFSTQVWKLDRPGNAGGCT